MAVVLSRHEHPIVTGAFPRAWPLSLARLTLQDFRNYTSLRLDLGPGPVVLTGPNGAGKTNLLEALSLLTPGRGLRRARLRDLDRKGGGAWAVAAALRAPDGPVEVGTGRVEGSESERRAVRIEGEPARGPSALAEVSSCIWLTPAMDRLLADSAAPRRRFLDRLVFTLEPEHAARVAGYEHALRERGRLLRRQQGDGEWLTALEARAAKLGVAIASARRRLLAGLSRAIDKAETAFPRPGLALRGRIETWLGTEAEADVERRIVEGLAAGRGRDAETGGAGIGPHRSDLLVEDVDLGQPAERSSTGRQKALLIAIVLAETRLRGRAGAALPLLLLDEVIAHLDAERRDALFAEIRALGAQAWLTGTDADLFRPLAGSAQFFHVRDATVHATSQA
ncbi:DNA replication/repair protein RecF [Marinivivus vitaminiproducens]|uniref:DNA replication/repair protein RecF n=1 Tax=Marinivivus vitaminiproducens TaxID=3035935 RepID=UPI00279F3B56|nr:DNA replication/repair protein RecF [Geminicoccaceae bacterium SCSIO 64248]